MAEFAKVNKNVRLLMGIMENRFVTAAEVAIHETIPSKIDLRAKLVGTMAAPVSGFVNVLAGNLRSLVYVLNAVAESKN